MGAAEDYINSQVPGGAGSPTTYSAGTGALYIGIPKGSETEQQLAASSRYGSLASKFGPSSVFGNPMYYQGYKTGSTVDELSGYSPDDIYALQQRLYATGMLDDFIPGQLDTKTKNAFNELLGIANTRRQDWTTTLDQISQVGGMLSKTKGTKPPPLTVTLSNPDDIRAVLHGAAMSLYGGELNEEQTQAFIATFQQKERDAQTQAYNQQYGGGLSTSDNYYGPGGETVSPPSGAGLAYEAEQEIRKQHPGQVFASAVGKNLDAILPGLARPGGGWI